jgi:transposase
LAFCWAQVRRDFIEAARRYPPHQDWMFTWVEAIRELYRINKQRVGEWNRERPLDQQSAAFERHHQALIAALSALDPAAHESGPPSALASRPTICAGRCW